MESQKYALLKAMDKIQDNIDSLRKDFMDEFQTIDPEAGDINDWIIKGKWMNESSFSPK